MTSKRSLVYHGYVTFKGTMMGFGLGIIAGVLLAMAIVRFRVMDMSVMPWAIISQTVPIVALAPMIITLSSQLGLSDRDVPKAIIAAYLSFFPVLVSMVKGLRAPDRKCRDHGHTAACHDLSEQRREFGQQFVGRVFAVTVS